MRYTKEQMENIYVQWQKSGQSRKDFCKEHHIVHSTFCYWIRRFTPRPKSPGFTEITRKPPEVGLFEVVFPSGTRLAFQRELSASRLRELVS